MQCVNCRTHTDRWHLLAALVHTTQLRQLLKVAVISWLLLVACAGWLQVSLKA